MKGKITICFSTDDWTAEFDVPLQEATDKQIVDLQNAFAKEPLKNMRCLRQLHTRYINNIDIWISEQPCAHRQQYFLMPTFSLNDKKVAPCCTGEKPYGDELFETCARNLRNGKCRDAFMRHTIGAVLFPELYANNKQK